MGIKNDFFSSILGIKNEKKTLVLGMYFEKNYLCKKIIPNLGYRWVENI